MGPFLFIVGNGRSGNTLLRAMFDAHSEMAIPGESHFIIPFARGRRRYEAPEGFRTALFVDDLLGHFAFQKWGLPTEAVRAEYEARPPTTLPDAIRRAYGVYARAHGKSRYGDKTPIHALHVTLLSRLFPEARFIHIIRDGRDAASSYFEQGFGPRTVADAAFRWKRAIRRARAAGARLGPTRYREVRYEELIRDPEVNLKPLCELADLPFESQMLRYFEVHAGGSWPYTAAHPNLRLPPTAGLRDWRREMAPQDVATFEALAGDLLSNLGYERAYPNLGPGRKLGARWRWLGVQAERGVRRLGKMAPPGQRDRAEAG